MDKSLLIQIPSNIINYTVQYANSLAEVEEFIESQKAIVVIDEQINAIIAMIADLRNHMEEVMSEGEEVVEVEATKLSQHDKFSMVSKFLNNNN